jgi:hypothetical protein
MSRLKQQTLCTTGISLNLELSFDWNFEFRKSIDKHFFQRYFLQLANYGIYFLNNFDPYDFT